MGSVMASLFLVALDQTILATALGKIVEEFNAFSQLSWIVTAYLITTTITVPIAGKLSDLFGRRTLLLVGVAIFTIGSLLCGIAGSVDQLILWRAVQGIGGGIITANAFTIVGDLFSARERGRWQGLIGAVFGLSSVVGPLLGGFLTENHTILGATTDWRWTFFINVPVGIIAAILLAVFCPPLRHAKKPKIDYIGAALLAFALGVLILAVDNTEHIFADFLATTGMSLEVLRIVMATVVLAALMLFVAVESRVAQPILPLHLFKSRNFVLVISISLLFGAAFMGSILYLTQFNQQVFNASPSQSGLMLLPMVGGIMVASIGSGQVIAKTGRYKLFMLIGAILAAISMLGLATLSPEKTFGYEAMIMVPLGLGLGVMMPTLTLIVQNEFKPEDLGVATSSTQLFRSLGSTIGTAVFGALLTTGLVTHLGDMKQNAYLQSLRSQPQVAQLGSLDDVNTIITLNTPEMKKVVEEGVMARVENTPAAPQEKILNTFRTSQDEFSSRVTHAFSESIQTIFVSSAVLLAINVGLVLLVQERKLSARAPKN